MTIRRWTPSSWVLASLGFVILLVTADQVRQAVSPPPPKPKLDGFVPRVGTRAVNFQLPDSRKKLHRLSDYRGQEIVLTFFCGCSNCQDLARQLSAAYRASGKSPTTVSVFTSHFQPAG